MIDKEYIKEIISRITKKKADGNIVPATASMQEIMIAVRDDALECIEDLRKAVFYIQDEIKLLEHGTTD